MKEMEKLTRIKLMAQVLSMKNVQKVLTVIRSVPAASQFHIENETGLAQPTVSATIKAIRRQFPGLIIIRSKGRAARYQFNPVVMDKIEAAIVQFSSLHEELKLEAYTPVKPEVTPMPSEDDEPPVSVDTPDSVIMEDTQAYELVDAESETGN